jgi:hypothetical protein
VDAVTLIVIWWETSNIFDSGVAKLPSRDKKRLECLETGSVTFLCLLMADANNSTIQRESGYNEELRKFMIVKGFKTIFIQIIAL